MCVCYLRGFSSESVYKTNRKRANPRFRIAAIYPSVNIQPLMKTPKIDIQQMSILLFVLLVLFLDNNVMSSNFLESSCNLFSYDDNLSSCEIAATTAGGVPEVFLWVFGTQFY